MTQPIRRTTAEAAKYLGIKKVAFKLRAWRAGINAEYAAVSGKRGRPADLWTVDQVNKIAQLGRR